MPFWELDDIRDFARDRDGSLDFRPRVRRGGNGVNSLADRLLDAKKEHAQVEELDEALFARDSTLMMADDPEWAPRLLSAGGTLVETEMRCSARLLTPELAGTLHATRLAVAAVRRRRGYRR